MTSKSFPTPIKIHGDGSSLYGPSKGTFQVGKIKFRDFCEGGPYEIQLFSPESPLLTNGQGTGWRQYTDRQIEKEVNEKFLHIVREQYPKYTIDRICWSEQGMQPKAGWSFDVIANNDEVNRKKGTCKD